MPAWAPRGIVDPSPELSRTQIMTRIAYAGAETRPDEFCSGVREQNIYVAAGA
jgi:hypothetical protein